MINYITLQMRPLQAKPYRHGKIRFLALFLASMLMFGNQYAFNNPQALEESFIHQLEITQTQFNMLYTIFAFPNIFTTLVLGILIDFLGVRIGVISLSIGVALSQTIVAFGGAYKSYYVLLIGRMIFGIASESLITAQASMVSFWFKGKELATALGIILTSPQIGNALNSFLSPKIYEGIGTLGAPLFVSVGFCLMSVLCGIFLVILDMRADRKDAENQELLLQYHTSSSQVENHTQKVKCSDIKILPGTFWVIMFLCMFALSSYIPFMDNVNRLFIKRFCFTQVGSGQVVMLTYLTCVVVSPFIGMLVDKIGKRRYFIVFTMLVYFIAHFLLLVYPSCIEENIEMGAIAGLVLLGFGYALYSNCLVPIVPIIVKPQILGTAFGLMAMIQSIALAFFPLIASELISSQEIVQIGFRYSSLFYTTMAGLGMILSLSLWMVDKKLRKKLDKVDYQQIPFTESFHSEREKEEQERQNELENFGRRRLLSQPSMIRESLLQHQQDSDISIKKRVSFNLEL